MEVSSSLSLKESSPFFTTPDLGGAFLEPSDTQLDFDLCPEEIASRVEFCSLWLVQQVGMGELPDFILPDFHRSLLGRHVDAADRFARMWSILNICHALLQSGQTATQRDVHYRLKASAGELFRCTRHLSEAIEDVVMLLGVPRSSLGITCSSKGLISGPLSLCGAYGVTDCSSDIAPAGRPIPGDLASISSLEYSISAPILGVLIVEKDAVFQQLARVNKTPHYIIVTGKGYPDLATRAFLAGFHAAHPKVPLFGVVDWNPSGLAILGLYKFGSPRRMAESMKYALPALRWLGVRSNMLGEAPGHVFQGLSARDVALMKSLAAQLRLAKDGAQWIAELDAMERAGATADIEAAYTVYGGPAGLENSLRARIHRQDWI